jgi:diguanylate cyclase (GGDEF)-like protein/PAS domain S-box-containing protein
LRRLADVVRSLGIRARLVALVLVVALPFACYVVFEAIAAAKDVKREVGLRNEALASVIAARLDDHVGDVNQLLATLSHIVSSEADQAPTNDRLLGDVKADAPAFVRNLVVFDLDGTCVGTTDFVTRGINVSDRRFFQQSVRMRQLAIDGPIAARGTGETVVVLARPIERQGKVTGVIAASVAISHLDQLLDVKGVLPAGAVVVVTTRSGVVLKQVGTSGASSRAFAPDEVAALAQARSGNFDSASLDGVARAFGFAQTGRAPWVIAVGMREATATAPVWERLRRSLAIGGCTLFVALLIATLIGRDISGPIARLTDDARRLGLGQLSHRPTIRRNDEIGLLGRTLDAMAVEIEHQTLRLARNERELRLLTDNLPALIVCLDRDARYSFVNAYAARLFGNDPANIVGRSIRDVRGEFAWTELEPHFRRTLAGDTERFTHRYPTAAGEREFAITYLPVRDDSGEVNLIYVLGFDLTERRVLEAKLERMAQFDQLTELPNRYLLQDRLAQLCHRSSRDGTRLALLYLDLDGFKPINDRHGHAAGDHLLRTIAARLLDSVRKSDTVARLGGDEFVIVVDGFLSFAQLHALARKIVEVVGEPVEWRDATLSCSVSIGVAAYPPAASWEALIDAADRAMYQAKAKGRGAIVVAPLRHEPANTAAA